MAKRASSAPRARRARFPGLRESRCIAITPWMRLMTSTRDRGRVVGNRGNDPAVAPAEAYRTGVVPHQARQPKVALKMLVEDGFAGPHFDHSRALIRSEAAQSGTLDAGNIARPLSFAPGVAEVKRVGHLRLHLLLPGDPEFDKQLTWIGGDDDVIVDRHRCETHIEMALFVKAPREFEGFIAISDRRVALPARKRFGHFDGLDREQLAHALHGCIIGLEGIVRAVAARDGEQRRDVAGSTV